MFVGDIRRMLDVMDAARIDSALNLTVGSLLRKLDSLSADTEIMLSNGAHLNGEWGSYRGYYDDLALEPAEDGGEFIYTAGTIKEMLNDALCIGEMTGYKGGTFFITEDTLLWLSSYGEASGNALVDFIDIQGQWYLIVKNQDE